MTTKQIEHEHKEQSVQRIVLNSKNSVAIKEAMREVSKEVMKKNAELYRRLAFK